MYIPVGPGFFDQLKSQPMRPIPLKPSSESEREKEFATLMTKKITRIETYTEDSALEQKLTGFFKVIYKDKSSYVGELKNGLSDGQGETFDFYGRLLHEG